MMRRAGSAQRAELSPTLHGRRVTLRPLAAADFRAWREVRRQNVDWLTKWEPKRQPGHPDPVEDRSAFLVRCSARERERQLGSGFSFGVFIGSSLVGEMNLNSIQRGAFQSAYIGYWIAQQVAGNGFTPEALVVVMRYGFEELLLHRVQIAIIPRNSASRRVVEKLNIRDEGTAVRYLEINGVWEDHVRYAVTSEEWAVRGEELVQTWIGP